MKQLHQLIEELTPRAESGGFMPVVFKTYDGVFHTIDHATHPVKVGDVWVIELRSCRSMQEELENLI